MINHVHEYPIDEIIKKNAQFCYVIPKYQREYTWSYKEWDALYNDITENADGYFIGSIICINSGDSFSPKLEVIDGQQPVCIVHHDCPADRNRHAHQRYGRAADVNPDVGQVRIAHVDDGAVNRYMIHIAAHPD